MSEEWIPIREGAKIAGYSKAHIRYLIRKGKLQSIKDESARGRLIRLSELLTHRDRPVYYTPCAYSKTQRIREWVNEHRNEMKGIKRIVLYERCKADLAIEVSSQVFYLVCSEQGIRFNKRRGK